jgi:hypothetical protein
MFDFLDSDWFIIGMEIIFITLISYDIYKYVKTKQKQYIFNTVITIGFAIWTLSPFYTKYYQWNDKDREEMIKTCLKGENERYCGCLENMIFKEYDEISYMKIDKEHDKAYVEFMNEAKGECLEY